MIVWFNSKSNIEVLLQTDVGIKMVPWLECRYLPVLLLIEVLAFNEQVACLDPIFDLSCHDSVGWLGLVPGLDHSECILELGGVFDGIFRWLFLLYGGLHSGEELGLTRFSFSPV